MTPLVLKVVLAPQEGQNKASPGHALTKSRRNNVLTVLQLGSRSHSTLVQTLGTNFVPHILQNSAFRS